MANEKLVYTVKELAEVMDISLNVAYTLTHMSNFPVLIIKRKRLIPIKSFEKWLESNSFLKQ